VFVNVFTPVFDVIDFFFEKYNILYLDTKFSSVIIAMKTVSSTHRRQEWSNFTGAQRMKMESVRIALIPTALEMRIRSVGTPATVMGRRRSPRANKINLA